jgi:uncharacterized repeat protein (TIGR03803 family)
MNLKKDIQIFCLVILAITKTDAQPINQIWGMCSTGGSYGLGTIFNFESLGNNFNLRHSFPTNYQGNNPRFGQLLQASNGKLYGMTEYGGVNGYGLIFEYDINSNTFIKKIDFAGVSNGANPQGSLMQASNGKIYGMTKYGGANNNGILFEYDISSNKLTKKIDFNGTSNGANPSGSLIEATNGKLYGMTFFGGINVKGILFEYDTSSNTLSKKIDFNGSSNGKNPYGSLIQATNGKLYGMTQNGGTNDIGVFFEYEISANKLTKKTDFALTSNGSHPYGSLMQASNGKLYGMTYNGGTIYKGILFEFDITTNTFTKKVEFAGTTNGAEPNGSLIQVSNGKLFGMTHIGGTNNYGVLFEYNITSNVLTRKIDFNGTANGDFPEGTLMQASNGKLYGMTYAGGTNNYGVLFEYELSSNTMTKKIDFSEALNGANPHSSLIRASNGKLYGMTYSGGSNGYGVLFEYDTISNSYTKKIDFDGTSKGAYPIGSLLELSNGILYGMTKKGGTNNKGVLFEYNINNNTYTKKVDFDGTNGEEPWGSLIQASNGKIFGLTKLGGSNSVGILFEYDTISNTLTKKIDFSRNLNGAYPQGSLMQASNGKLYGMTYSGSSLTSGVLFDYDISSNTITKKIEFTGSNGADPYGSLIEASNGKLYGMTYAGGTNDIGILFEYDTSSNTLVKKIDFNGSLNGANPFGSPIQATDGKLYGITSKGGIYDYGVLFEYNIGKGNLVKKFDLVSSTQGASPIGDLVQITFNCSQVSFITQPVSQNISVGQPVTFYVKASRSTLIYQWKKNGVDIPNATDTFYTIPSVSSANIGTYNCYISSGIGCTFIQSNNATLSISYNQLHANFSINDSSQCKNNNLFSFTNNSTLSSGTFTNLWKFGDTNTSTSLSPTHSYSNTGIYTVQLITTSNSGDKDSLSKNVYVRPHPFTTFSAADYTKCLKGNNFKFTNGSTIPSGTMTYVWQFGDATTSTSTNPNHSYTTANTFQIKLISTSNYGCKDSLIKSIIVKPSPVVYLGKDTTIFDNKSLKLNAGSGFESYLWSNNDTNTSITVDTNGIGLGKKLFWVRVTKGNCDATDSIFITFIHHVSIYDKTDQFDILAYPNPTNDILNIALYGLNNDITLKLTDLQGKSIISMKVKSGKKYILQSLDISELAKGVYILKINGNDSGKAVRILKY